MPDTDRDAEIGDWERILLLQHDNQSLRGRIHDAVDETRREREAPTAPFATSLTDALGMSPARSWREGWAEGYTVACDTIRAALADTADSETPAGEPPRP